MKGMIHRTGYIPVVKEGYLCSISLTKIDVAIKEKYGKSTKKTGIIYKYSKALKLNLSGKKLDTLFIFTSVSKEG